MCSSRGTGWRNSVLRTYHKLAGSFENLFHLRVGQALDVGEALLRVHHKAVAGVDAGFLQLLHISRADTSRDDCRREGECGNLLVLIHRQPG